MEQVELEHQAGHRFRIASGSFQGEPAIFTVKGGRAEGLEAGYMYFKRGSF